MRANDDAQLDKQNGSSSGRYGNKPHDLALRERGRAG